MDTVKLLLAKVCFFASLEILNWASCTVSFPHLICTCVAFDRISLDDTPPPPPFLLRVQGADKKGTAPGGESYLESAETAEKNQAELKALLK